MLYTRTREHTHIHTHTQPQVQGAMTEEAFGQRQMEASGEPLPISLAIWRVMFLASHKSDGI